MYKHFGKIGEKLPETWNRALNDMYDKIFITTYNFISLNGMKCWYSLNWLLHCSIHGIAFHLPSAFSVHFRQNTLKVV